MDNSTAYLMNVYAQMAVYVGKHTTELSGLDESDVMSSPANMIPGIAAMQGFTRAIARAHLTDDMPKNREEFASRFKTFCGLINDVVTRKFNGDPKDFISHVCGYAVLSNMEWDHALADVLESADEND